MTKSTSEVGSFFGALPRQFKLAEPKPRALSQEEKVQALAGVILARLFKEGSCSKEALEQGATAAGLTGRAWLQVGVGVGGQGGMRLLTAKGQIVGCGDNAHNLLSRLGQERFTHWLAEQQVGLADFRAWLEALPSV
jgi:hypothetical protein